MATHREIFNQMKKSAQRHKELSYKLGKIEQEKFGFSFSDTDSDEIIDALDYGNNSISFDSYLEEMNFYKKSFDENDGDIKGNGIFKG